MDNLPSKDQAYAYLKGWGNKVKQYAYNLTPMELKVEEATNNDAWGPTGTLMAGTVLPRHAQRALFVRVWCATTYLPPLCHSMPLTPVEPRGRSAGLRLTQSTTPQERYMVGAASLSCMLAQRLRMTLSM